MSDFFSPIKAKIVVIFLFYFREKQEKISALLKNAAISQSEDIFKQELRQERDEIVELTEKLTILQDQIKRE